MDDSVWKKIGRMAAGSWGKPRRWVRTWANQGARRRTFESTRDLVDQVEEEVGKETDHNETTCVLCYHDFYDRYPENPEDFKYGKG